VLLEPSSLNRSISDNSLGAKQSPKASRLSQYHMAMARSIRANRSALKNMALRGPGRPNNLPPDASRLPWSVDSIEHESVVPRSRDSSRTGSPSEVPVQADSRTLMREVEASMAELKEQIALIERLSRLKDLEKAVSVKLQESSASLKRSESEPLQETSSTPSVLRFRSAELPVL